MAGDRIRWIALVAAVSLLGLLPAFGPAAAIDAGPRPLDVVVSFDTTPSGLGLELDGSRTPTPHSFVCGQGTWHALNATTPLSDGRTTHSFRNWTDGLTSSVRTFVCDVPQNFTAVYGTEHLIEVDTRPGGLEVVVEGNASTAPVYLWCSAGGTVGLLALESANGTVARHFFGSWSDGGAQGHRVTCDGPATYTAFYRVQYLISVFTQPQGLEVLIDGSPSPTPASLWCDEFTTHTLNAGQAQAIGGTQFRFERWVDGEASGARTIPCGGPMNYSALFVQATPPTPAVDGVGWTFVLFLSLVVLIPFIAAGIALALRSSRRSVRVLMPVHDRVPPARSGLVSPRSCPRCGTSAEPDWMYCMACGSPLR